MMVARTKRVARAKRRTRGGPRKYRLKRGSFGKLRSRRTKTRGMRGWRFARGRRIVYRLSPRRRRARGRGRRRFRLRRGRISGFRPGINLYGYSRGEIGLGESCRLIARAIEGAGIPFGVLPIAPGTLENGDMSWASREIPAPAYKVNLIHVNSAETPLVWSQYGPEIVRRRLNIGYWLWELPEFPDEFLGGFQHMNEIWVPTRFVQSSIAAKSPVPVVVIPQGVYVDPPPPELNRASFGLPEGRFLFLCMYDTLSQSARKNPQAAIEAFARASAGGDLQADLVVKVNHPTPQESDALRAQIAGIPNVHLIDRVMGRGEVNALLQATDGFVSLHRAEGFGLPLAEAMYLGKPVIGTNWSGNTDFMNDSNSGVVNYSLVQVGQDYGVYRAHQTWAEPDIEHAAHLMRVMASDETWRSHIAGNGRSMIHSHFSPSAVGQAIRARLALHRVHMPMIG